MPRSAATIVEDFNRAGPGLGSDWQQLNSFWGDMTISGSTVVISNTSTATSNAQAAGWVGAGAPGSDQWVSAAYPTYGSIGASDYSFGVIGRGSLDTDGNRDFYYFLVRDNGTAVLGYIQNGADHVLNDASVSWASGDKPALEFEGTTIRACKDTTPLGGAWTVTDSTLSGTVVGVAGTGAIAGDTFRAGNIVAGGGSTSVPHLTLLGVG